MRLETDGSQKNASHTRALRLEGLSKRYSDNVLFQNLNLEISPGTALHVRGANGSGKTQLMLIIAGLVEPDSGRIVFHDPDDLLLNKIEPDRRARVARYVPYLPQGLAEIPIDRALLIMTRRLDPFSLASQKIAALNALTELDAELNAIANNQLDLGRALGNYSLGQQKRFMATASIGVEPYPFLVMLDEPLAGLDSEGIARVLEMMREARARGIALMVSEHRQEILEFAFDDVLKLPYIPNAVDQAGPIQSHKEVRASARGEAEIILRATNLVAGYATSPVECPSFKVARGSVVVIRGPNGSGKTGFIRSLLGRPGTVLSGLLEFEGEIVSDLRLAHQQSLVRYLSQKRDLFPDLSVQESIEVAGRNHKGHLSDEIGKIIDRLGPRKLVRHLSSGGRTLLGLAQALAGAPRLLILDEPLANTDLDNKKRIRVLIDHACRLGNMAVIVIEHDATLASGSEVYRIEMQGSNRTLTKV